LLCYTVWCGVITKATFDLFAKNRHQRIEVGLNVIDEDSLWQIPANYAFGMNLLEVRALGCRVIGDCHARHLQARANRVSVVLSAGLPFLVQRKLLTENQKGV
jgi:hypothetical protein